VANVLDRLLATLDTRLHAFALCEVQRGFRLVFSPMEMVVIHYVLSGTGSLQAGNGKTLPFAQHSILVVPPRQGQRLSASGGDTRDLRAEENCSALPDRLVKFSTGTGRGDLLVLCGAISATYGGTFGLFDTLSEPIVEDVSAVEHLRSAFQLMLAELSRPTIGTRALTEALMKQCLVVLLRQHFMRRSITSPLFAALQDPRLTQAVALAPGARFDRRHEPFVLYGAFCAGLRPERARFRFDGAPPFCSRPAHHHGPAGQSHRKLRRLREPKPLFSRFSSSVWGEPHDLPCCQRVLGRAATRP
jgi:Cupin